MRGGCRYLHPPLTVPTHRYSLFCTCFMTKCLSASVQHPGVPTHKQAHPCSLCTPHSLPSVALPSSPAHREKSAGSASPKGDMSCKHPKAAYFGIGSQTHGGGGQKSSPTAHDTDLPITKGYLHSAASHESFAKSLPVWLVLEALSCACIEGLAVC